MGERVLSTITYGDLSILSKDRIFNIGNLFPLLPKDFNDILIHFSNDTEVMYDTVQEFYDELATAVLRVYN